MKTIQQLATELSTLIKNNASATEIEAKRQEILRLSDSRSIESVASRLADAICAAKRCQDIKSLEAVFGKFTYN